MPTLRDQAIVLRRWDFSETSQTVSLFCREHGLLRGLAKGAKRERGKFCGGFEPVTRGEVVAIVKPTTDLANIIEWDLQEVFQGPRRSLRAFHGAMFLADLVDHAMTQADPHAALWDELVRALTVLDGDDPEPTLLRFQWATLVETGHRPELNLGPGAAPTLGFDPDAGRLVPDPGPDAGARGVWRIRRETVDLLRRLDAWFSGATPDLGDAQGERLRRANLFLASHLRWVIGRDLPTLAGAFPDAPGARRERGMRA
ncbi:MAG: DNA repair protein RecO [Phycisphaerales bacterium]